MSTKDQIRSRVLRRILLASVGLASWGCGSQREPGAAAGGAPTSLGGSAGAVSAGGSGVGGSSAVGGAVSAGGSAGAALADGGSAGSSTSGGAPSLGGALGTGGALGGTTASAEGGALPNSPRVLLFSRTTAFRHDSIPSARTALLNAGKVAGFVVTATEDAGFFVDSELTAFDVVVFLSTTGNVLDDTQQGAFERFIRSGNGFVGIHAASDTEYDWPFYGGLVGAYFREHPAIQAATLEVEDPAHPTMLGVPSPWMRTDEWYSFKTNPRPNVHVLMTLDETSYSPGSSAMGADHPITWLHEYEGGRAFYTALGHTAESYADPSFMRMLIQAISWAGER